MRSKTLKRILNSTSKEVHEFIDKLYPMEELIFESDKKKFEFPKTEYTDDNDSFFWESGFKTACSYKNNQMQEFDKWKAKND